MRQFAAEIFGHILETAVENDAKPSSVCTPNNSKKGSHPTVATPSTNKISSKGAKRPYESSPSGTGNVLGRQGEDAKRRKVGANTDGSSLSEAHFKVRDQMKGRAAM